MPSPLSALVGRPVIVTGQQAGLFGGPLLTLIKLLDATIHGRAEDAQAVFWIECDDADIREVDTATVVDSAGTVHELHLDAPDDGRPVGSRQLGASVDSALDRLRELLGPSPEATAAVEALVRTYGREARWQDAFAAYMAELAGPHAPAFLDPTTAEVKAQAASLFARVLAQGEAIEAALAAGAEAVAASAGKAQVPFLEGHLPVFVLDDDGRRHKLLRRADGFALKGLDGTRSKSELEDLLARSPERFSAAVLLRPVLQDSLLATSAYVAGPAEAAYHRQLGPLYEALEVTQPRVVARRHVTVVEPKARRLLGKLDLSLEDATTRTADELLAHLAAARAGLDPVAATATAVADVERALAALGAALEPAGPDVARVLADARKKMTYQLEKVGTRASTALTRLDEGTGGQLGKLTALLAPGGTPQERVLVAPHFLARTTAADFVAALVAGLEATKPGEHAVVEV